jgi:hypothetical protein
MMNELLSEILVNAVKPHPGGMQAPCQTGKLLPCLQDGDVRPVSIAGPAPARRQELPGALNGYVRAAIRIYHAVAAATPSVATVISA